ncbi:hypothetical protein [Anaerorudis cellulosivorans]|nr:hypothetical protein [Seramator thermalis]MCW1735069.1 hypothetical protein [Seramator thermalis]
MPRNNTYEPAGIAKIRQNETQRDDVAVPANAANIIRNESY